ncbi:spore germination protein [Ectobacillus sp. JY-23]|uniref:spore germination protein n=1 Tax=Ectobacillus sp. JY-23 TaxID=2933872 RepID=UPI001FF29521|nr:spore germination protein [Ectobacillus sp. JY-23]UOY94354.1 spore germination protein [Ectobacillus sp. JY-23]
MAFIRNVKIMNNNGHVNIGNCYNISSLTVSKASNGAGGNSTAFILNGVRANDEFEGAFINDREPAIDVAVEEETF